MRPKLTYSNVMSTLCFFLLLSGGAAYAASQLAKNSVGTKQLKNGAVTAKKVKKNSLTGAQINESTLGTVPNANRAGSAGHADTASDSSALQGSGPNAFVHGDGSVSVVRRDLEFSAGFVPLVEIPGIGNLTTFCEMGPFFGIRFTNTSGGSVDVARATNNGSPSFEASNPGSFDENSSSGPFTEDYQFITRAATPTIASAHVVLSNTGPKACSISAQVTLAK